MKNFIKVTLIFFLVIIGIIVIDTLQARIFKHSPLISRKESLADADSWVDRGIIIDTYYCTKESDIVTVSWKMKSSKYTCPIDNVEIETTEQIIRVNGTLYYNTEKERTDITCGTMDGKITSNISSGKIPKKDNQSNFPGEYGYQTATDGTLSVFIDGKFITFEKR